MTRDEIIKEIKPYFGIKELVCDHTYSKFGENSWNFLDTAFLETLLIVRRDIIQQPMVCNGSGKNQRGLRCNRCQMVRGKSSVYLSAHVLGKAGDFTIPGMSAEQARTLIRQNASLLPYPIRMEKNVGWLHLDVRPTINDVRKVIEFYA